MGAAMLGQLIIVIQLTAIVALSSDGPHRVKRCICLTITPSCGCRRLIINAGFPKVKPVAHTAPIQYRPPAMYAGAAEQYRQPSIMQQQRPPKLSNTDQRFSMDRLINFINQKLPRVIDQHTRSYQYQVMPSSFQSQPLTMAYHGCPPPCAPFCNFKKCEQMRTSASTSGSAITPPVNRTPFSQPHRPFQPPPAPINANNYNSANNFMRYTNPSVPALPHLPQPPPRLPQHYGLETSQNHATSNNSQFSSANPMKLGTENYQSQHSANNHTICSPNCMPLCVLSCMQHPSPVNNLQTFANNFEQLPSPSNYNVAPSGNNAEVFETIDEGYQRPIDNNKQPATAGVSASSAGAHVIDEDDDQLDGAETNYVNEPIAEGTIKNMTNANLPVQNSQHLFAASIERQTDNSPDVRMPPNWYFQVPPNGAQNRLATSENYLCNKSCMPLCANECNMLVDKTAEKANNQWKTDEISQAPLFPATALPPSPTGVDNLNGMSTNWNSLQQLPDMHETSECSDLPCAPPADDYSVPIMTGGAQSGVQKFKINLPQSIETSPNCLSVCQTTCLEQCNQLGYPIFQCGLACRFSCEQTCVRQKAEMEREMQQSHVYNVIQPVEAPSTRRMTAKVVL